MTLTQNSLKQLLDYDPLTGVFTRKVATNGAKAGSVAGGVDIVHGYTIIRVDSKKHRAHRLAWLYMTGTWPTGEIDHINGVRADNRIANLRDVTRRENSSNLTYHRAGHLVGTNFRKDINKWAAYIRINGKLKNLGHFLTREEASAEYQKALANLNSQPKGHTASCS